MRGLHPMSRRNWNKVQPSSIRHAMELCVEHGRERQNLSVERIAELMGLAGHHSLYKWLAEGRMPAVAIRPFEHACGATFLSRYIAHSAGMITMPIPRGSKAEARDINTLQACLTESVTALIQFHDNKLPAEECLAALKTAMESLGWHHANVEKSDRPELGLFEENIHG